MKIFISYSRDDAGNFAKHIHRYLRDKGHAVFIDVNNITIGDPWARSIEKNISECDIFVVILTPDSLTSSYVDKEILQAQKQNKIIVPCIHEHVEYNEIKWGLEDNQGIEFSDKYELALNLYPKIKTIKIRTIDEGRGGGSLGRSKPNPLYGNQFYYENATEVRLENDNLENENLQKTIKMSFDQAKDLEDLGQYDRALKQYEKVIKIEPYNFLAIYNKALLLERIEKFDEALQAIEKAIDLKPTNTDVWYHKACIFEKLQNYEEAIKALDIDLKIDSKDVKSWTNKAKLLEKMKRYEEAIKCYENILRIEPKNTDVLNKRKIAQEQLDKKSAEQKKLKNYYFVTKWGSYGAEDGQFDSPQGIVIDSAGYVYVADVNNNRIQKFDNDGNFITKWGSYGSGDGQFKHPRYIAIDSAGYVYVSDYDNYRIQKFDNNGKFITKWGSLSGPFRAGNGTFNTNFGIAIDSVGYVYVADHGNNRIQKFDSEGNFITKWGSKGSGDGQFYSPQYIAIDSSICEVYVADRDNKRIQKFNSNGNFITKWGSKGSSDGEFETIRDITIDLFGYVYVSDRTNCTIQKFDRNGNFITKLGSQGTRDGEFRDPEGIAVDSSGYVYVADWSINRIQVFAPSK